MNLMEQLQFDQSNCKVEESKMAGKPQLLAIILAISISVGYARTPKKILNGEDVSDQEIPHQVSLQKIDGHDFCSGSIIDPQLILTAAHCIIEADGSPKKGDIWVLIGAYDTNLDIAYLLGKIVRRVHHNFHRSNWANDIAILKIRGPIDFNGFVAPANLPFTDVQAGTIVMASGWGATTYNRETEESGNYSRILKKHYGTVITQEQCQKAMKNKVEIGPEHICIEPLNGADTCKGDSGGPLTYNGQVIGITSFGIGCGLNYPSVFTRVNYYWQWIRVVQWAMSVDTQFPSLPEFVEA